MSYGKSAVCMFLTAAILFAAGAAESAGGNAIEQQPTGSLANDITVDGDRLTINVENVDVAQLLRMISVRRRMSIVTGPNVAARISLSLYDVTYEQAMDSILDVSGYTAVHKNDVILVTEAASRSELPIDTADMQVKAFSLNYADPTEVSSLVEEFTSPAGTSVVSAAESVVLVMDTAGYLDRIASLIEQIDVPPQQVLIEVGMYQVTYSEDLTFGVELGASDRRGVTDSNPQGNTLLGALTSGFAGDFTLLGPGAEGLFAGVIAEDAQAFVEALAGKVDIKTLANPKILALDRQPANIMIGDRLGYKVATTSDGATVESVVFLDVGTELTVTPRIDDDGLVLLNVSPQVSSGNISTSGLPSESTAEAATQMLVRDGQTVVLGGLISETTTDREIKVPLLGDIPLLGHLFKRTTRSENQSELVVLITPRIVGPEPDEDMKRVIGETRQMSRASAGWDTEGVQKIASESQQEKSRLDGTGPAAELIKPEARPASAEPEASCP